MRTTKRIARLWPPGRIKNLLHVTNCILVTKLVPEAEFHFSTISQHVFFPWTPMFFLWTFPHPALLTWASMNGGATLVSQAAVLGSTILLPMVVSQMLTGNRHAELEISSSYTNICSLQTPGQVLHLSSSLLQSTSFWYFLPVCGLQHFSAWSATGSQIRVEIK